MELIYCSLQDMSLLHHHPYQTSQQLLALITAGIRQFRIHPAVINAFNNKQSKTKIALQTPKPLT